MQEAIVGGRGEKLSLAEKWVKPSPLRACLNFTA